MNFTLLLRAQGAPETTSLKPKLSVAPALQDGFCHFSLIIFLLPASLCDVEGEPFVPGKPSSRLTSYKGHSTMWEFRKAWETLRSYRKDVLNNRKVFRCGPKTVLEIKTFPRQNGLFFQRI